MPVSGNKEPGELSRQSSSVSAGIPLKKRRFLLVQPPSPPHQEVTAAPPEENDVKKKEDSSSNISSKEESSTEAKNKEESGSDLKGKEKYISDVKSKEGSGSESKRRESVSDLNNKGESAKDLKNKEDYNLAQGYVNANLANSSLGIPDVGKNSLKEVKKEIPSDPKATLVHPNVVTSESNLPQLSPMVNMGSVSNLQSRTKLLLTEKSASAEYFRATVGAHVAVVKKEIPSKLGDEDCKLKLSTGSANNELSLGPRIEPLPPALPVQDAERNSAVHDKLDTSLLSLSLRKGEPNSEEKNSDVSSGSDATNYECSNRSKWDLNTTMDDWEGSAGDGALQGSVDASSEITSVNVTNPTLSSILSDPVSSSKGKQVIATDGQRPSFSTSSVQQNHQPEDATLRLTLSTFSRSSSSAKVASRMDISKSMRNTLVSAVNINSPGCGAVKTEPIDENSKNHSVGATVSHVGLLEFSSMKREPVEMNNIEAARLPTNSSQKLIEQKSVKSEQAMEVSQDLCKTGHVISQHSVAKILPGQDIGSSSSSVLPMPLTPLKRSPSRLIPSSELSASIDVSNQSENSVHTKEVHKRHDALVQAAAADVIYKPVHMDREATVSDYKVDTTCEAEVRSVDDREMSWSKGMNEENVEGSVSDEEKINISTEMMDDESYGSDCESDGNQAFANPLVNTQARCIKDDDDYEDGEVREPMVHSTVEEHIPERSDTENVTPTDHDTEDGSACVFASCSDTDQFLHIEKESESKVHDDKTIECIKECVGKASNEIDGQLEDKDDTLQRVLPDMVAGEVPDEKLLSNSSRTKLLDCSGKESVPEGNEKDIPCDGTTSSVHRTVTTIGESTNGDAKLVSIAEKPDSSLSIVESSFKGNNAAKDSSSGGNRSRIINLPRASLTSPGRTRSIADRSLSLRSGKDRHSDIEGEKFLHRNRDEVDTDGSQRFIREKIYDHPYRNSRPYGRGRGRFSGRLDTSRGEWDTEREFALESYNNDYRFSRNKRASAMIDAELESNEFVITPDGSAMSTGRGRKPLNDDLPSFRHLPSRRLSPGGRDGPSSRDIRMLRRIPRNISPSRRNDENGSDLVGLQHDEKLVRSLPDEMIDPAYTRPQPIYDGGAGQFVRGNRNFSAVHRRGFPRIRSKSPVGSRGRSPGPWSPPRRRSPDGFGGLPQLTQHRSAPLYGMERIRSPERSCFPEEMVTRRRGSPSFMARPSNDMRDVESGREHGHPRPMNSSRRSPSDRVFGRSTRRLDVSDPRIGTGEEEYFGRPVHSNRFHEFHGDGSSDERRKCSERRGLVRPFRPPYIGDGENLRFHLDEGPRPFRFCAEGDTEFGGRSMREREFDGRIKNRPMVAPRRIRNIEEQEGNYRHSGQVWHDDGFNEAPGFKRRRF